MALQVSKEKILGNCWNKEAEFQKGGLGWPGQHSQHLKAGEQTNVLDYFVEQCFFQTSFNKTSHYSSLKSVVFFFFTRKSRIDKSKGKSGIQRLSPKVPLHAGRTGAEKYS